MATSKRLKNTDGVRGTHPDGMAGTPPVKTVIGNGASGQREEDGGQGTGTEASTRTADLVDVVNFGMGDIRSNAIQVISMALFSVGEEFDITATWDHGPTTATTGPFTHGTDATAAAMQTALRISTGDALLVVLGTTDEGPFTVFFSGAATDSSSSRLNGNRQNIPTLSITGETGNAVGTVTTRGHRRGLGESELPTVRGPGTNGEITTDTTGPAAGGIDVNYTIGSYTGVEVVICADGGTPNEAIFDGFEASSTPFRIEAADFDDGVGPGTAVAVDVYVRGYLTTDPADGAAYSQVGPWSAKVDGTLA